MAIEGKELELEKDYLSETLQLIDEEIKNKEEVVSSKEKELYEVKKYIWDNKADMDEIEIKSLRRTVNEVNALGTIYFKRGLLLKQMINNPYFGRIDFDNKSNEEYNKIYIGLASVTDDKFKHYVVDWRAPISTLYYDFEIGKAYYRAPMGIVNGNIDLKRQYKIKNRELEYAFDSSININDEILQETLANNASEKMKNIVTTIQKEQNKIIRNDEHKTLIVEGPAGSGKTSVALHHIAYLLYKHRKTISSSNILIFSPSDIFSEYISEVLPNLGEESVFYSGFSDYMHRFISEYILTESYMTFLERISNTKDEVILSLIEKKLSNSFTDKINEYINTIEKAIVFKDIYVNDVLIVRKNELEDLFNNEYKSYPLFERIYKISNNTQMKYRHMTYRNKLNSRSLEKTINDQLYSKKKIKSVLVDMYNSDIFKNYLSKEEIDLAIKSLNNKELNYEDAIIYLYLQGILNGFAHDNRIKYVVIDEAQDYNSIQYLILKNVFISAKFVILGDANQMVNTLFGYDSIKEISHFFNKNDYEFLPLTTTYRNTYEISMFCNNILGLENLNSVNRHGDKPRLIMTNNKFKNIEENLKDIDKFDTVGIVTKTNEECREIYDYIKNKGYNCGSYHDDSFSGKKIHVLPIYYAKGLEFDYVIVIDTYLEKDKKLMYVACTRALHKLDVIKLKNTK